MKNMHVLATDKPSRVYKNLLTDKLFILENSFMDVSECNREYQNIYITSDEEIKEGDWCVDTYKLKNNHNPIFKWSDKFKVDAKKIILTTDELYIHNDLIPKEYNTFPQYIQKIDDEFLEWFIKNPSCENVEVEKEFIQTPDNLKDGFYYKIIIPKEEPKQELKVGDNTNFGIITDIKEYSVCFGKNKVGVDIWYKKLDVKLVPKKETLEEVAEIWVHNRFTKQIKDEDIYASESSIVQSHILFAKWQQERTYSEEEDIYSEIEHLIINWNNDGTKTAGDLTRQIIEQIKKK
jgi:hypothetical protein